MPRIIQFNPTRMELLKQKKRLETAQRAHDLLEEKRDELIQRFFPLLKEVRRLRKKVQDELIKAYGDFQVAKMINWGKEIEQCLLLPAVRCNVKISRFTSLGSPQFEIKIEGDPLCYGFYESNWKLDEGIRSFQQVLSDLLELAQKEEEVKRLAREIERTRRRVNALEHIFIPQIKEIVKYITMKLDERERAHIVNLMKIKQLIQES
ncbi:V-type ATP synthase subunit D [Candidatus Aerophobetes bacterium]|uniref:V-type ATP synthase subunit D n=1 Tax=Aerophobetes bacterium TaxID=2030807 RepID=A0A662DJB9_UNCAE|nr:MAG: V-type ATP synthase subunit D [Candidatus Aerophobetes bacterium]